MTQHTPGPWRVGADLVGICVCHSDKSDYTRNGHAKTICKITHASWADVKEHVANAKLIASAPALLEALIALYSVAHVDRDEDYGAVTNAAAVIERATGEPTASLREPNLELDTPPDDLLGDIWCAMNHARIFIVSREKMHQDGVKLYDDLRRKIEAIVAPPEATPASSQSRGAQ